MLRYSFFLLAVLLLFNNANPLFAQVSEGGFPLQVKSLKSAGEKVVQLQPPSQAVIDSLMEQNIAADGRLKSFRFAKAIPVNFNPSNSGVWYLTSAGYNVWKLNVSSEGAYSLNLIFDNFELPPGARLFLYNEKEEQYLGAYTSLNNKQSRMFAVSPLAGDELTVQYEVPQELGTPSSFEIVRVNHDFTGILKSDRRPLGLSGECNVDANCEIAARYRELKNAVCRLIVDGEEICSGTLVNNTAEDQKPYILSAAHCYDEWDLAKTTVYVFNYESPYCAPLDGDPVHSISGAVMKAQDFKLDFALAEMSLVPPPTYRPYYAGWNHSGLLPDSCVSIHHPQGDIKKISIDNHTPVRSDFSSSYVSGAFLKVLQWDAGVTESGSSGGGLFNTRNQLVGTLTGGVADCEDPVNDYFASLAVYWDYSSDTLRQAKYWLDPKNTGASSLDGKQFYEGENLCGAFTNLTDDDEHVIVSLTQNGNFSGYWGGSNQVGITEMVERFNISGNESLAGVSLGIGKLDRRTAGSSSISVKVYEGSTVPERLLYSKQVALSNLVRNAMNYIPFDEDVEPIGNFFVGINVEKVDSKDTIVLYQSLRESGENHFIYKLSGDWVDFESNGQGSMVNVMELIACNYNSPISDTPKVEMPEVWLYPNPAQSMVTVQSDKGIDIETVSVFSLIGQEIDPPLIGVEDNRFEIDLSGQAPGTYIVRFNYDGGIVSRKISLVPY